MDLPWVLLSVVVFLLVILTFVWPPDSPWSPWWRTNKKIAQAVVDLAQISKNDVVFELGSGDGGSLVYFAQISGARCVGVEIEITRFLFSLFRRRSSSQKNKISFVKADFKKVDLSKATVIYMYLVPRGMQRLLPKFDKELAKGVRIVSYRYKIPMRRNEKTLELIREDKKNRLFLYLIRG